MGVNHKDLIIVGGGAAGFYAGIHFSQSNPNSSVLILEQSPSFLSKVKVSGGGRCNVTNCTLDPKDLVKNYPRGHKELLGPFYTYGPLDVISFFENHGVSLKEEDKGRMFPVSNSSASIVNLLMELAQKQGIELSPSTSVKSISKQGDYWKIGTNKKEYLAKNILIASGSSKAIWKQLSALEIPIVEPVPSLFTFKVDPHPMSALSGLSSEVEISIQTLGKKHIKSRGPLLITHQGFSGPAVLECSAWGARELYDLNYQFELSINWFTDLKYQDVLERLMELKSNSGTKTMLNINEFNLPKRLWEYLVLSAGIQKGTQWAQLNKIQLVNLANQLNDTRIQVVGKSTFKEEFVSAGGVDLHSVNFKTMESKIHSGLYFAGEVLNIDAITGGYNFQNAWTTAYIAGCALSDG